MIIHNLNVLGSLRSPSKAKTELIVDPHTPLSCSISFQRLEAVAGRCAHVVKRLRKIKLYQLAQGLAFDLFPSADAAKLEESLGVSATKQNNHACY
jgi:hypothetical protein